MPEFKVTAFVPSSTVRGGGTFGMLVVVENTTDARLSDVVALAGEYGWGEGEEIGGIPAQEGRRATLNLRLKESGDWAIPIWVGRDEEGAAGWKGVITTGVDPDKDHGVKKVTLIGQQITGERGGWGSVNEVEMNLKELAHVLDEGQREQIHKGLLVPVAVQLESREPKIWQNYLQSMRRTEEPKPETGNPTVNVTIHNSPPEPSSNSPEPVSSPPASTSQSDRGPDISLVAIAVIAVLVVGGLLALLFLKEFEEDVSQPRPPEKEELVKGGPQPQPVPPPQSIPDSPSHPLPERFLIDFNKKEYQEGDSFSFRVTIPQDGYLYVIAHWDDRKNYLLFPTENWSGAQVHKGQIIDIPGDRGEPMEMLFPDIPGNLARGDVSAILSSRKLSLPIDTERDLSEDLIQLGLITEPSLFAHRGPKVVDKMQWNQSPQYMIATDYYLMKR